MLYVLTQKEYEALVQSGIKRTRSDNEELQKFCTKVANEMPIKFWGREEAKPWTCVITNPDWYCDECLAQEVCPYEHKEWSK